MNPKRTIEVFSAGCPICEEVIAMVRRNTCPECEVTVSDLHEAGVAAKAKAMGVRSVPAVAIGGQLANCCAGRGPDEATLLAAGLGKGRA